MALQFGTRHWTVACILVAIGIAGIQLLSQLTPRPKYFLTLWIIPIPFRFVGAKIGAKLGIVAEHTLAWYAMMFSLACWILLVAFVESPVKFFRDFMDGLAAGAMLAGIFVAAILEFYIGWSVVIFRWSRRAGDGSPKR